MIIYHYYEDLDSRVGVVSFILRLTLTGAVSVPTFVPGETVQIMVTLPGLPGPTEAIRTETPVRVLPAVTVTEGLTLVVVVRGTSSHHTGLQVTQTVAGALLSVDNVTRTPSPSLPPTTVLMLTWRSWQKGDV